MKGYSILSLAYNLWKSSPPPRNDMKNQEVGITACSLFKTSVRIFVRSHTGDAHFGKYVGNRKRNDKKYLPTRECSGHATGCRVLKSPLGKKKLFLKGIYFIPGCALTPRVAFLVRSKYSNPTGFFFLVRSIDRFCLKKYKYRPTHPPTHPHTPNSSSHRE